MDDKKKILITGANGFVGSALVKRLKADEERVLPLVRRGSPDKPAGEIAVGNLEDFAGWAGLLTDVDAVVHLAARVHQLDGGTEQEYHAVNVALTKTLALAARAAGVRRFVYVSTVKVNGEQTLPGQKFKGEDTPAPEDAYGRSKLLAENALREVFEGSDTELVIIRPPLVYGPAVRANFARLESLARTPLPLPFARVDNRRDLVSIYNLCDFITLCIRHPDAAGRTWMVADANPYSLADLIGLLRGLADRPAGLFPVPVFLLQGLLKLLGKSNLSQRLLDNLEVDAVPAEKILGWKPQWSLAETMAGVEHA